MFFVFVFNDDAFLFKFNDMLLSYYNDVFNLMMRLYSMVRFILIYLKLYLFKALFHPHSHHFQ
ncbi:hypothetical protein C2R94_04325 [Helicobacter pylori]|nr:hypothetical protein C2R94_04325 [Helicobacter pylori]